MGKYLARADNTGVSIVFQELDVWSAKMYADNNFSVTDTILLYKETARGLSGSVFGEIVSVRNEGKWN